MAALAGVMLALVFLAGVRVSFFWRSSVGQFWLSVVLSLLLFALLLFFPLLLATDPILTIKIWMTIFFPMICGAGVVFVSLPKLRETKKEEDRLAKAMLILVVSFFFLLLFSALIWF